jgi:GNAT superfamily N-acetyltransferase
MGQPPADAIEITMVPFGTPLYERTKRFREALLRTPLGLELSEQDLAGEQSQIHIAAVDRVGVVRGTVLLKPISEDTVKLRQMAVCDKVQGAGLGRKLVTFAEQVAKERGFKIIEMHARVSALGFYEKLGYATEGEKFIEVTVPTILMKKALVPPHASGLQR